MKFRTMHVNVAVLLSCFIFMVGFEIEAQDTKERFCGGKSPFTGDDLIPDKWGKGSTSLKFGNSAGQKIIFLWGFKHDLKRYGHVAIVCRALLTTSTFVAGTVENVGKYEASVMTRNKTDKTLVWGMKGDRKSHGLDFKVTLWAKNDKEKPTVDCMGIEGESTSCDNWHSYVPKK